MALGTEVGLGPGHIALDGDPALTKKGGKSPFQFTADVCCGQTARWIKMLLGTELGLGPGHIVLDGDPTPSPSGAQPPIYGPCLLWPNGWTDQHATWYRGRSRPR